MFTFVLAGAVAGLAGWLLAIRTSGATANLGTGMLFHAFAAVVIGGASLKGGIGKFPGVYAGVLLCVDPDRINLMGLPAHYSQMILGGSGAGGGAARYGEIVHPAKAGIVHRSKRWLQPTFGKIDA